MKTTLELPDALVKQVKLRALQDGRKLKETVADLLRRGLAATEAPVPLAKPRIGKNPITGLPRIEGGHPARPGEEITPERLAEILHEQEIEWYNAACR